MKKISVLLFFFLLSSAVSADHLVLVENSVRQGEIVRVKVYGNSTTEGMDIQLRESGRTMQLNAPAFSYIPPDIDLPVWIGFIGIPSTLPPGGYTLFIDIDDPSDPETVEIPVVIGENSFLSEEIPLNSGLTGLRRDPDPRKLEEARMLRTLLNTCTADALFCTGTHTEPLTGYRKTSFYGDRRTYRYSDGSVARSIHNGIDMALETGTPVAASGAGRVIFSGEWLVTGNTVIIEHLPGVLGLYFHLDELHVETGDIVSRGEHIGTLGMTGLATGPHLHWEIRVNGTAVDPSLLIEESIIDKHFVLGHIDSTENLSQSQDKSKGGD